MKIRILFAVLALVLALGMLNVGNALAAVWTDQNEYIPGSVVTISGDNSDGAGYLAGETVNVAVSGPNDYAATCQAVADDNGTWLCQVTLAGDDSAVGGYTYTAVGQVSGVTQNGTFTDGPVPKANMNCPLPTYNPTHYALLIGQTVDCTITNANLTGSPTTVTVYIQSTPLGNETVTGSVSGTTITFTYTGRSDGCETTDVTYDDGAGHKKDADYGFAFVDAAGNVLSCNITPPIAQNPTVSKTAHGSYDRTYTWTITKAVDKTLVKKIGGTATFNYTVNVSHNSGKVTNVKVTGTITVNNPNTEPVLISGITDALSDGTVCKVTGGGALSLPAGDTDLTYKCDLAALPVANVFNTATVTWSAQTLGDGSTLAAGSATFSTGVISFAGNKIDECVAVNDAYAHSLGTVCVGDSNPTKFTYSRVIPIPQWNCQSYENTATFTTNDTGATGSASKTVQVCGPLHTGALTMGYWRNKNGQAAINGIAKTGICPLATWLRQYAPFQDLVATATCAQVANYVTNIVNAANASGTSMNAMLKSQMLATALDASFYPLGDYSIDLTMICTNLSCNAFENSSSAFGGSPKTIWQMLAYAASQSNSGGSMWYGNSKYTQELAKDAFDAVNNQVVFGP